MENDWLPPEDHALRNLRVGGRSIRSIVWERIASDKSTCVGSTSLFLLFFISSSIYSLSVLFPYERAAVYRRVAVAGSLTADSAP
jgi:hypothetical protein